MKRDRPKSQSGRLRIVAGNWRSRLLQVADLPGLRPTPERVRETLFNWLATKIHGALCLDLCAGTGVLGLEALSRGASATVFVERSAAAVQVLRKNIESLQAVDAELVSADARDYLRGSGSRRFDIVFLDPPFAADLLGELCRLLADSDVLADGAHIYVEKGRDQDWPDFPDGWVVLKEKTAGNVSYALLAS